MVWTTIFVPFYCLIPPSRSQHFGSIGKDKNKSLASSLGLVSTSDMWEPRTINLCLTVPVTYLWQPVRSEMEVCQKLKIFFLITIFLVATWLRSLCAQWLVTSTGSKKLLRSRPGRESVDAEAWTLTGEKFVFCHMTPLTNSNTTTN